MKTKLRPLGHITSELEPLLLEMMEEHELQLHEVLGMIFLWAQVHMPGSIEVYEDGTNPILKYGPANET